MDLKELKQEAEEYTNTHGTLVMGCEENLDCTEFMQEAYIASAEPREKRIAELEGKVSYLEDNLRVARKDRADLQLEVGKGLKEFIKDCPYSALKLYANAELEKENADLKCECRRCVYSDSPCILSDYGKDRNGICDHFKDVFDEVAELKEGVLGATLLYEHLTKAKEILSKLANLDGAINIPMDKVRSLIVKAEQFLSGVEE